MAATLSLKLSNRTPHKPIRKLPESVELPGEATVDDLKKRIATAAGIGDYNRLGIFDPSTKKTLKNRRAKVADEAGVVAAGEVLVKDLGPQISWRMVFVVEYLGPLIFHTLIFLVRPYVYPFSTKPLPDPTTTQVLASALILLHFSKRELETLLVHKFSANTMPAWNIFRNSAHYWLLPGAIAAWTIQHPWSLAARADALPRVDVPGLSSLPVVGRLHVLDVLGLVLFGVGEAMNAAVHLRLAGMRSSGGTERGILRGLGAELVTCPNYMWEVVAWLGIIVVSRDPALVAFLGFGIAYMWTWAVGKEKAYRREFGDKYKKKRYTMLPGLI